MNGIIFFICSTTAISVLSAVSRISAWLAARKRWPTGCKNRMEKRGWWQSQCRRRRTWPSMSRQVLRLWTVRLRRKAQGCSRQPFEKIGQVQGNLKQDIAITTQRRVPKDGEKMQFWMKVRGDSSRQENQEHLNCLKIPQVRGNSSLQETQKPKAMTKIGHTISTFQQITCCTWRRSSRSWDKDMVAVRRIKWKTSMWNIYMGFNHVCHSSSCSSSWFWVDREYAIY